MKIIKRDGNKEDLKLDKIQARLSNMKFIEGIDTSPLEVDTDSIAIKVVEGLYEGVTSKELDELAAELSESMTISHTDYDKLAARIEISSIHKETIGKFSDKMSYLHSKGIIDDEFYKFITFNKNFLDSCIDYSRDYSYSYFGIKTLLKSYLMRVDGRTVESPQDLIMRVSAFLYHKSEDKVKIKDSYERMSLKEFTHATPTLFNAGTKNPQLSSCFLLDIKDDSIDGIYDTLKDTALISKSAGGVGLSIHKIRSQGSKIRNTGVSDGIIPMLKVFNETARYVNQEGKRKGSFAIYLEPWHSDILDFLNLKKNHGKEEMRARDLFYAMWIPDLFMERVKDDGVWTLFDPKISYRLPELYGDDFRKEYERLELQEMGVSKRAREIWNKIIESQIETGTPYMLYKDTANSKSNQKNLGTIKSSNLCAEIIEYTSENEQAVCNLGSMSLPSFVLDGVLNYKDLYESTRVLARNLDKVIDLNKYPNKETEFSNKKNRPIGLGVQGLADVFSKLNLPFDSNESRNINKKIFETIYKACIDESIDLARIYGPYESYKGSPASKGVLQFDMYEDGVSKDELMYDWTETRSKLNLFGLRNSLSVALMPTASTSQILGNNECFEPFTSNIYSRRTLSGEFYVCNKYLVKDLLDLGLWDEKMINTIVKEKGSIQRINIIPDEIKEKYKTVYEMSMRSIIDMASDRQPFVCQSQSMNLFVSDPSVSKLSSMHFYAWDKKLKTGMYYLRTKPATDAISGLGLDTSDCLMCSG